jgi:hypothetical protein
MNNSELIRTLNYDDLLSISEILCIALRNPSDIDDLGDLSTGWLPDDVFEYVKGLTDYERLKLIQLIINTLIHEAEKPTVEHFQTLLPLKSEQFYRP